MLNDLVGMRVANISNYKRKISDNSLAGKDDDLDDMDTWPNGSNMINVDLNVKAKFEDPMPFALDKGPLIDPELAGSNYNAEMGLNMTLHNTNSIHKASSHKAF